MPSSIKTLSDTQDPRELLPAMHPPLRKLLEDVFQHNENVNQRDECRREGYREQKRGKEDAQKLEKSQDGLESKSRLEQENRMTWNRCPQTSRNTERLGL